MAAYKFITSWKLNAPVQDVWNVISEISRWHEWWHGVLEVRPLAVIHADSPARFAHTWRSFIPYKLRFETEVTGMEQYNFIQANVTGELEGTGRWVFTDEGNGYTTVTYFWYVRTTMAWMNLTAPVLGGVFRWNHDTVMRWGGQGLAEKLNCAVAFSSKRIH
jgi:hypothetical protein